MKVQDIDIRSLREYANNPRNNDNAVEAVAASIREFGFKVPLVVSQSDDGSYEIVAGHTRLKAARMLELETVPCIVADDLTPEQIRAFRLADNKVGELAGWDFAKLEEELSGISGLLDMTAFGFDEPHDVDIDSFFEDAEQKEKEPKRIQCPHCGEWFEA